MRVLLFEVPSDMLRSQEPRTLNPTAGHANRVSVVEYVSAVPRACDKVVTWCYAGRVMFGCC